MLYLHSIPVQVWQKQPGGWVAYNFNASVVSDVAKWDSTRTTTFTFDQGPTEQGYQPRLNDILVPIGNMQFDTDPTFQGWYTRPNQPWYYEGASDNWIERPGLMFLTAYNEGNTYEFSDLFSLSMTDIADSGTRKLSEQLEICSMDIWNRLTPNHPFLKQATRDSVHFETSFTVPNVTYDGRTVVKLNELAQQYAFAIGYNHVGGSYYSLRADGSATDIGWLDTMELEPTTIDLRQEDILQLEVRSREASDSPNYFIAFQKDNTTQRSAYYNQNNELISAAEPNVNDIYGWRTSFGEVDDTTDVADVLSKAREVLTASPYLSMVDISIVLDMSSRYSVVYSTNTQASWSMPVPGSPVNVYGYDAKPICLPVREYNFASGQLLLATNDDITLESGH